MSSSQLEPTTQQQLASDHNRIYQIHRMIRNLEDILGTTHESIQQEQFYIKEIDNLTKENYDWEQKYSNKEKWKGDIDYLKTKLKEVQHELNILADEYTSDVDELASLKEDDAAPYKNKFLYNYRMSQNGGKKKRTRKNKKSRKSNRKRRPRKSGKKSRKTRRKTYKKKSGKKSGKKSRQ